MKQRKKSKPIATLKIVRFGAPDGKTELQLAYDARAAAQRRVDELIAAQPKPSAAAKAAYARHCEDDRLWNDHLRRLTQLKALTSLLSTTDGGDLEAFGADVLTIAADLSEQCRVDFDGRLIELAVKGSRAEMAEAEQVQP